MSLLSINYLHSKALVVGGEQQNIPVTYGSHCFFSFCLFVFSLPGQQMLERFLPLVTLNCRCSKINLIPASLQLCVGIFQQGEGACAFCLHCSSQVLTSESSGDGMVSGRNFGQFASSTQGQDIHAALKDLNQSATMSSHNKQDQLADFYICNHFTVSPSVSCTHLLLPSISSDCRGAGLSFHYTKCTMTMLVGGIPDWSGETLEQCNQA